MISTQLVEGKYGHGGKVNYVKTKLRRLGRHIRGRRIGRSSIPFDWTKPIPMPNDPIKNQGQSSSCGRQSGAYAQRILLRQQGYDKGEISAKAGYGRYAAYGGGMTLDAVETCIGAYGAALESEVSSYDINGVPLTEAAYLDQSYETPALLANMTQRAGFKAYNVDINKEAMAEAIRDNGNILILIYGQNGNQPRNWLTPRPSPPVKTNPQELWAHYMCGAGTTTSEIAFFQSWGQNVGDNGKQYFGDDYIDSGYIVDCITFVPDKDMSAPSNSIWRAISVYFHSLGNVIGAFSK